MVGDVNPTELQYYARQRRKKPIWFEEIWDTSWKTGNGEKGTSKKGCLMTLLTNILGYLKEYCACSGVHGFRYLSEERRNWFERLFWMAAIAVSAIACSLLIRRIKERVDNTPVMVSFAESPTNIWHIPFPAVTLCPLTKCRQSVFNSTQFDFLQMEEWFDWDEGYKNWVESIYSQTVTLCDLKDIRGSNDSVIHDIVDYFFGKYVLPQALNDDFTPELRSLLTQMFLFVSNTDGLQPRSEGIWNETIVEPTLGDLWNNSVFQKTAENYYPEWYNETNLKLYALRAVCLERPGDPLIEMKRSLELSLLTNRSFMGDDILGFLAKVADTLESTSVTWGGSDSDPSDPKLPFHHYFTPTLTEEGFCYTFNMLNKDQIYRDHVLRYNMPQYTDEGSPFSRDWNFDKGYIVKGDVNVYPRRATGVGTESGLTLDLIQNNDDIDHHCNVGGATGYKVALHRPEDQPSFLRDTFVYVPFNKLVSITISPSLTVTSSGLKNYDPDKRQCLYSYENHLEYFKFYSQSNCELECLTKAALKLCNCVTFYMPRTNNTKLCGEGSVDCLQDAWLLVEKKELSKNIEISDHWNTTFDSILREFQCACLPTCVSVSYGADVTSVDLKSDKDMQTFNDSDTESKRTTINIFYKYKLFTSSKRSELYGKIDLVANFGGALGLTCGFSLLSLIEIIYFATLRLWVNLYRKWTSKSRPLKRKRKIEEWRENAFPGTHPFFRERRTQHFPFSTNYNAMPFFVPPGKRSPPDVTI